MNPLQQNVNGFIHMINNVIKTQDVSLIMKVDHAILSAVELVSVIINDHGEGDEK
jgi:hypothetical protein